MVFIMSKSRAVLIVLIVLSGTSCKTGTVVVNTPAKPVIPITIKTPIDEFMVNCYDCHKFSPVSKGPDLTTQAYRDSVKTHNTNPDLSEADFFNVWMSYLTAYPKSPFHESVKVVVSKNDLIEIRKWLMCQNYNSYCRP